VSFDRSTDVDIYITVQLQRIAGQYPSNGDETMKLKIAELFAGELEIEGAFVEGVQLGEDVYSSRIYAATSAVPGHIVRNIFIGKSSNPTLSIDVPISDTELATTAVNLITIQGV
jgi:hypothetical protein